MSDGASTEHTAPCAIEFVSTFDDADQLAGLYQAAALGRRSPNQIVEAFRNSQYAIFVVRHGRLIGAGRAFGDEVDCAVICDLAVDPDFQASGYGEQILELLKQRVRHHLRIILYAKPGKESFYLKRGFNRMRTAMLSSFVAPAAQFRETGLIE